MPGSTLPVDDPEAFAEAVEAGVSSVRSVDGLRRWLLSRPNVVAVDVADYLVKTLPPQRELRVACRRDDGSTRVAVIDVIEGDDGDVSLGGIHDD